MEGYCSVAIDSEQALVLHKRRTTAVHNTREQKHDEHNLPETTFFIVFSVLWQVSQKNSVLCYYCNSLV